ncbi:hypothetical protein [Vibrio anguillarum]|uniref:hypothetical protein n=1 Tax=Vibrio anguillarum TaxID=55601 RepID=UPI00188CBC4A|nr:hypothetical protein [Vibrio anguillarum]MBF4285844.1 hypothetical protein [Vibrio anguillarum]
MKISLKNFSFFTFIMFLSLPVLANCDDGKGGIVPVNSSVSILHKGDYQKNISGLMKKGLDKKKATIEARDYPGSWAVFDCKAIVKLSNDDFEVVGYELVPTDWTNLNK